MARFTASRPRVRSKRATQWGIGPGGVGPTNFSATGSALLGSGVTFGASGTVIRIRGWLSATLDSYTTASNGYAGAVGIGLVSAAAFAAGIASVPTPITEAAWDGWLWHQFIQLHGALAAGSTSVGVTAGAISREVDTKAMRKVFDEMVIFAAAEFTESGTAALRLHLDSRLLLKLG